MVTQVLQAVWSLSAVGIIILVLLHSPKGGVNFFNPDGNIKG
ncbi:hypothetical protein [Planktothrix agardhii]|nr:hypothetical protein [Planktothrix agardhii]